MFWQNYAALCREQGDSPNGVAKKIGISSGSVTNWKYGVLPHRATLQKIADHFGVPIHSLFSHQVIKKETAPTYLKKGKKKMTISKIEVKTHYNIELDESDVATAIHFYNSEEGEADRATYPKALDDLGDNPIKKLGLLGNSQTYAFLANFFGFDGWENAGYYHATTHTYRMSVFTWGAQDLSGKVMNDA